MSMKENVSINHSDYPTVLDNDPTDLTSGDGGFLTMLDHLDNPRSSCNSPENPNDDFDKTHGLDMF